MAVIISYPVSSNVLETDLLLGTHIPPVIDGEPASTKNFTVGSIVSLAQAGMSNSIDLQGVLDNGSTVDFEEGGELVLLGDTPYDRRITFVTDNGETGIDNQHSATYIDVSGYQFTGYKGNGGGGGPAFDVGTIEINEGKIEIYEEIQSSLNNQKTSLSFEAPVAVANIKIPAKPTDGDYILATLDDIPVAPYKVYTALLSQTGTNAPVATVLENTIGNIIWTRYVTGSYEAKLAGAFVTNKTVIFNGNALYNNAATVTYGGGTVVLDVRSFTTNTPVDGAVSGMPIEIRVYN